MIKYIITLILIFLLINWGKNFIITSLGGYTRQTSDTIRTVKYLKGRVDTLEVFKYYTKTKGIISPPIKKDSIKKFKITIKDSLIDGAFIINNSLRGDVVFSEFKYKPLFPKILQRLDTLILTKTVTKELINKRPKIGFGVGLFLQPYVSAMVSYTSIKNWQLIYEVNPITFNEHSIKILYNF